MVVVGGYRYSGSGGGSGDNSNSGGSVGVVTGLSSGHPTLIGSGLVVTYSIC